MLAAGLLSSMLTFAKSPSDQGIWKNAILERTPPADIQALLRPSSYARVQFDVERFREAVAGVTHEAPEETGEPLTEIRVPDPDGKWRRFLLIESPVLAPALAANFPLIKSYRGISPDDPTAHLRLSVSHKGCRIQVLTASESFYVEPYLAGNTQEHISYYRKDLSPQAVGIAPTARALMMEERTFPCTVLPIKTKTAQTAELLMAPMVNRNGETLRNLRLAIAATGEYTAYHGGTIQDALAALNDLVTRVTGIYEVELSVRLTLVANNNLIIYTNAATDPFGNDPLDDVQADIDAKIGNANYDVGHVVSTGSGGVAVLGSVYVDGWKAQGYTGLSNPIGDPFWVDYVAHELGHQFGANHTFNNGSSGSCAGGNRNASTAYEPGSGSTIMAYAGICGSANNLQNSSDPYFHSISLDEINAHLSSVGVPAGASTGNTIPTNIDAGPDLTVPAQTPFSLTASATDPDGDTLTYCWEQRDLGAAQSLSDPDNGSSPLFRSFSPTTDPTRTFPRLNELLQNTTAKGEKLPTVSRNMKFRVTVRDNRAGGGGVDADDRVLTVDENSGPFVVTYPNSSVVLPSGVQTVTWNVANTNTAPVNAPSVRILLSVDGGVTFPITLLSDTANDGSATVTLPPVNTTTARIKVSANQHVFFDISNANFTIETPSEPSLYVEDLQVLEGDSGSISSSIMVTLLPANASETVTVAYTTGNGTATAGSDYVSASGTLSFLPGETMKSIPLSIVGDLAYEGDESFTLSLSNATQAIIEDAQGVITIQDNEIPPPVITSATTDTAVVGVGYSYQLTATNSPQSYGLTGTLPPGLQFNSLTGLISGTPTSQTTAVLSLSASNASGTDQQSFTLQVVENSLSVAADQARLDFVTSGSADWFAQTSVTYDGVDALQSGNVGDNQSSVLSATVEGPEVIGFRWKVSSEPDYDFLQVLVDGAVVRSISGEVDWQQTTITVGPGVHTVEWRYVKDEAVFEGSDRGWVDDVILGSFSPLPLISSTSLAVGSQGQPFSFQVTSTGTPTGYSATGLPAGLSIHSSTGLISGTPTQAGDVSVTLSVTNAAGSSQSSLLLRIGTTSSSLASALDQPSWTFITGGDIGFSPTASVTFDGQDAAASGAVLDDQTSWMSVSVEGPGDLTFWWNSSSEEIYDTISFSVNGLVLGTISGETAWTQVTQSLGPGTQQILWVFSRDGFDAPEDVSSDRAWVDQISFQPTLTPFESYMTDYVTSEDGPSDDPENDGVKNLLEYAFGLNPLSSDSDLLPQIAVNPEGKLEVSFNRLRPELTYRVQGSYDLETWTSDFIQISPQGGNSVLATDNAEAGPTNSRFLRFEIIAP
jgi:hypothetical protein